MIKIIETPRDGMQGLPQIIPAKNKINYINSLLKCGFQTVEVGSFVSPKAIPQLADTETVINGLDIEGSVSEIAVLIANKKGGQKAVKFTQINKLFYPFSPSPTFLKRNLNTNLIEAEQTIDYLHNLCIGASKELVVFLSLAFGNPYGDLWNIEIIIKWVEKLMAKGILTIPLAETIGDIAPKTIFEVCSQLITNFPEVEFGLHTHAISGEGIKKIDAAYKAGIRRFDTVLGGLGGCPMTGKKMIANLNLHDLLKYCDKNNINYNVNKIQLKKAEKELFIILNR